MTFDFDFAFRFPAIILIVYSKRTNAGADQ